jgi:predicted double-glycine peptidase
MRHMARSLGSALGLVMLLVRLGWSAEPSTEAATPRVTRHTLKELRDLYVVKQRQDYSCGAAALATLMRYYYNEPTTEAELLRIIVARLSADEQRLKETRGFSLLDLKYAAEARGYRAAGFKLTVEDLARLAAPVIVFIQPLGYKHFAVLRGVSGGRVFLADPARGNVRMTIHRFLGEWDGIVFVLGKPGEEQIHSHPLSIRRPDDIGAPVRSITPLWESGEAGVGLARRSGPR